MRKPFRAAFGLTAGIAFALAGPTAASLAQSPQRYNAPPPIALSPDLASPWLLQLSRKPSRDGSYATEIARPAYRVLRTDEPGPVALAPALRPTIQTVSLQRPAGAPAKRPDGGPGRELDPKFEPQIVSYDGGEAPGTIVIDTEAKFLYLVGEDGQARRYGVGVGRPGFEWAGEHKVTRKAEWPGWSPPPEMIEREKARGKMLPAHMAGGPENPLGARALYLGSSLYRIHGTNQPWSIGKAVSSGCIRMRNEDVIDLYERVGVGARVIVS